MIPLRVLNVVGSSRNLIKMAPIMAEMRRSREVEPILVHTGQHHRDLFSSVFLRDMGLPEPRFILDVAANAGWVGNGWMGRSWEYRGHDWGMKELHEGNQGCRAGRDGAPRNLDKL